MINEVRKNITENINDHLAQNSIEETINSYSESNRLKVIKRMVRMNHRKTDEEIIKLLNDRYGIRTGRVMIQTVRDGLNIASVEPKI